MNAAQIFRKADYQFLHYEGLRGLCFKGAWMHQDRQAIGLDSSAQMVLRLAGVSEVWGRFVRHDWSGKIKVSINGVASDCFDLFSPFRFEQCLLLFRSGSPGPVEITVSSLGQHPLSKACQTVFLGAFLPVGEGAAGFETAQSAGPNPPQPRSFYEIQTHMVDNYSQSLVDRGISFEEEAQRRWSKYALRFREMLVYTEPGHRVLDIGSGFQTPKFLASLVIADGIDYWAQDIDDRVVENNRSVFAASGLDPAKVRKGTNTQLAYADGFFDLVFSSHCLEHSDDLDRMFAELFRIVRPGGHLFFAVPFGYDEAMEHPYAIDPEGWYRLAEQCGFEVVNQHIGNIYPEGRHDLIIVGKK